MGAVLEGVKVIDLSWGIAGPLVTMGLSDYGAEVIKVEPPGGDPFRRNPAYVVWNRGKKSVILDLKSKDGQEAFQKLVGVADVMVESYRPGVTARLGIDYPRLHRDNPGLVYCSITGYGRHAVSKDRPAYDILVQARSGMQNEQPGHRDGPIFLRLPLPSLAAAYLAQCGIASALHAREVTGKGQWVETSLMQGVLAFTTMIWNWVERPPPGFYDILSKESPANLYQCADGLWVHCMGGFDLIIAKGLGDERAKEVAVQGMGTAQQRLRTHQTAIEAFKQMPRHEWLRFLSLNDVSVQAVRPTSEAFEDAQVLHNGMIVEVEDPKLGTLKQVGPPWRLELNPAAVQGPSPEPGQHAQEILNALDGDRRPPGRAVKPKGELDYALGDVTVLDFGAHLAGPFGPMVLGELGARVIKIEAVTGEPMRPVHQPFIGCQRGKECIAIDLKRPEGQEIAHRLAARADVVAQNLRVGVAERLGIGYSTLKKINPRLIYCHTNGYGITGPRAGWPGLDQLFQAMCGAEYEAGPVHQGNPPIWYRFGMCDTGNAFQSAIAMIQGLYHRDRSGRGQLVTTNLLNCGMYYNSDYFEGGPEGLRRPALDKAQTGLGPLYRLYRTARGWLAVAAVAEEHWRALCSAIGRPEVAADARFADATARQRNAADLASVLEEVFAQRNAGHWYATLDAAGVPCEVSDEDRGQRMYRDPEALDAGWFVSYEHPEFGRMHQFGPLVELSETPGKTGGPPPLLGQHTRAIMAELGYSDEETARLKDEGVITWPEA
ncbi:MAG: CoA transferase [Dehalococcoidia bacterium]